MFSRVLAPALALALALPAFAGDAVELKLLPKPKKGQAEEITFDVAVSYGDETETLNGKMRREIKAVDDDGLASSEQLEILSGDYRHEQPRSSYGSGCSRDGAKTVKRSGKTRQASLDFVGLGHVTFPHTKDIVAALRRDPDAFARAVQPDDKVKVDDRWEVEPQDLLWIFVGTKTKLLDGSKAVATLDSLKKKDDVTEAAISVKATVLYTKNDDPDTKCRLSVEATLRGTIDGSAPPRKEKVTYSIKEGDDKKVAHTVTLERAREEKDKDDDSSDDGDAKKKKKPKKEKDSEDK